jgi:hypothetical protein
MSGIIVYLEHKVSSGIVSGIPLQKDFSPFAKEKNRAAWLESD